MIRLTLVADDSLADPALRGCQQWCGWLAEASGEPVRLLVVSQDGFTAMWQALRESGDLQFRDLFDPHQQATAEPVPAAPMSSAEFVWREDGRPDWGAMWTSFCELALYGGPPHRGEDSALYAPAGPVAAGGESEAVNEIRRGIWETTGLYAEAIEPGWVAVTCRSRKMAAWLAACIVLENVDARFEDERLYLPASPDFTLKDEVKSVITVLAKTHHYWEAHASANGIA